MNIYQIIWPTLAFLACLQAYVSYTLVARHAVAHLAKPLEKRKEEFRLPPLTTRCPEPERLISVLQFCRLIFAILSAIPVLWLTFYWSAGFSWAQFAVALACLVLIWLLVPESLLRRRSSLAVARATVSVLYPLFWLLSSIMKAKHEELALEQTEPGNGNAETTEEESEEFKGDILKAISTIGETTVREVMTPRVDMVSVTSIARLNELHQMFKEHKFSRLPVYKEKVDNIIGIVSVMDLVSAQPVSDASAPVTTIMRPAAFVPETKKVYTLLLEFRQSHTQMAIVIDEYGGTSGLVTLEDLLEEIVGEIADEHDEQPFEYMKEKEGTTIVAGKFPIEKLEELFGIQIPAEDFETISGLIFSLVGKIPVVGEIIRYKNLSLEIVEADKRRIHRIRIRELPPQENPV